jgi:protein-tyrosine phosphatase
MTCSINIHPATPGAIESAAIRVRVQAPAGEVSANEDPARDEEGRARRKRLLTVCFGNLFRSPMAEALLRARLPAADWEVSSAGTHALGGDPPSSLAQMAITELEGIDMADLRSSPLTVQDLMVSDYIFTMSRQQAAEVLALVPEVADRVRLLGSFAPLHDETLLSADPGGEVADPDEIGDPIGGDLEVCLACCRRIAEASDKVAAWLLGGADEHQAPPTVAAGLRIPVE